MSSALGAAEREGSGPLRWAHALYELRGEEAARTSRGCASVTLAAAGKAMRCEGCSAAEAPPLQPALAARASEGEAAQAPAAPAAAVGGAPGAARRHVQAVQPGVRRALGVQQQPPRQAPLAQS